MVRPDHDVVLWPALEGFGLCRAGIVTFVGPTICYAFMQAAGLVDDHLVTCFRHKAGR